MLMLLIKDIDTLQNTMSILGILNNCLHQYNKCPQEMQVKDKILLDIMVKNSEL